MKRANNHKALDNNDSFKKNVEMKSQKVKHRLGILNNLSYIGSFKACIFKLHTNTHTSITPLHTHIYLPTT